LKHSFKKILIIQTAFIGDVILATAVVEKLAHSFPDARIDFLLRKGNEGLLDNHPFITKVFVWNKKRNKNRNLISLIFEIRKEKYDLVINLQRFASSGLVTSLSNGAITVGFDKNPLSFTFTNKVKHHIKEEGKPVHEVERNHELIALFTDPIPASPRLYPTKKDFENIQAFKQDPYICIGPASVWYTKQFPKEKWIEFIKSVPTSLKIYLIGAPSDHALSTEIIAKAGRSRVEDLSGKLSFLQSAALMADSKMNYVNDSAPMHIASAMNAPVTAIYCSTIPAFGFGPLSSKSTVVEVKEKLDCRPCGLHGYKKCPKGHFKCGYDIDNADLLSQINEF
jgi:heptosyltransferase-2